MSGGAGQGFAGLGQALGGIGNAVDGVFDQQRSHSNQLLWAASAQEAAHQRLMRDAQLQGFMPDPSAKIRDVGVGKEKTFREELQAETDEWLKDIKI